MNLRQYRQSKLPQRFGKAVQAPVEAALGKGLDGAVAGKEVQGGLLIAGNGYIPRSLLRIRLEGSVMAYGSIAHLYKPMMVHE